MSSDSRDPAKPDDRPHPSAQPSPSPGSASDPDTKPVAAPDFSVSDSAINLSNPGKPASEAMSLSNLYEVARLPEAPIRTAITGPRQCGQYRLIRKLGEGGMGEVFEAEDESLHRKVAVKRLRDELISNPDARERFLREARAAAAVENDHLVTIYQVGEEQGFPYFAMQLLFGEPLDRRLTRAPELTYIEIARYARQMGEGLGAAHAMGLIHRDIKPSNIWLEDVPIGMKPDSTGSGGSGSGEFRTRKRIKVVDFGLAVRTAVDVRLTQTGFVMGTPAYMSPEQAKGMPFDSRTDIFSLGCVIFEMVTGRRPFLGTSLAAVMTAIQKDVPPLLSMLKPDMPKELSDTIARMLAKQPGDRPASAFDVADRMADLEARLTGKPAPGRSVRLSSAPTQAASVKVPDQLPSTREVAQHNPSKTVPESDSASSNSGLIGKVIFVSILSAVSVGAIFWFFFARGYLAIEVIDLKEPNRPTSEYVIYREDDAGTVIASGKGSKVFELPPGAYKIGFERGVMPAYEFKPDSHFLIRQLETHKLTLQSRKLSGK